MNPLYAVSRISAPILADSLPLLHDIARMNATPTGGLCIVGTVAHGGACGGIRSFYSVAFPVQFDSRLTLRSGCKDWPVNKLRRFL
jgi:hypothetical protein